MTRPALTRPDPPRAAPTSPAESTRPRATGALAACLALLAAVLLSGCGSGASATTPDATAARTVPLTVQGLARSYLLEPATHLAKGASAAVVLVLHQEGGTPEGVAAETHLTALRDQGATLVYPAGYDKSWDAGLCCGLPKAQHVDDLRFLDTVLSDVATRTPVDVHRLAVVGYSSGGMLTYRYVCARPRLLAAAVVVSGSLEAPCARGLTLPDVLALHGGSDGTIGLVTPHFVAALGLAPTPAATTLQTLAASAGCNAPTTTTSSLEEVRTWAGCRGGTVQARILLGKGHGWGGLDATPTVLGFLRTRLLSRS